MTWSLQIKSGTYYAVVRIPDATGKEHQKWISTGIKVEGNNKREANKRMRKILVDMERQQVVYSADILFLDWIDKWMEQKSGNLRKSTLVSYRINLEKHIRPHFQPLKLKLQEVNAQHIQDYYNKMVKEGQSANSIAKHNAILRGALQDAMKKGMIAFNPVGRATLPKRKKFKGAMALTAEQANTLIGAVENEPVKPAIILALCYGMRKSEVLGLRWKDVDFKLNTIHICNTVVAVTTPIEEEDTKSEASRRTLHIIPETRQYFLNLKRQQDKNRLLCGNAYIDTVHVCVGVDGKPFTADYLTWHLNKVLNACGLPHIRFHDLRHSAASLLLSSGLSPMQVQWFLGHEQISTTLDLYGHLYEEGKKETANTMGSMLEFKSC